VHHADGTTDGLQFLGVFQRRKGTVPLLLALFTMHHADENTNGYCPLVYSRGEGNYSPSHVGDAIKVH